MHAAFLQGIVFLAATALLAPAFRRIGFPNETARREIAEHREAERAKTLS